MSFWRFGFAQSTLDSLLAGAAPPTDDEDAVPTLTLEQLLEEDELLQELKSQNAKLVAFLARPQIIRRMLSYVDGTAFDTGAPSPDDTFDERERKKRKYPYLCSEILCADVWTISDVIFKDAHVFLAPFWHSVLERDPTPDADHAIQLTFWAKVNGAWLGMRMTEMLDLIKSLPNIVERLVAHIAAPSVADLLFRIVQCEEAPRGKGIIDWLAGEHLVSRLVVLLAPKETPDMHNTVAEFLKAVIAFCSNANAAAATAELQPNAPASSPSSPALSHDEASADDSDAPPVPRWASNRLLRDLASLDTVSTLVGYILDPPHSDSLAHASRSASPLREAHMRDSTPLPNGMSGDEALTPRPPPSDLPSRTPSPNTRLHDPRMLTDSPPTSSALVHSASVLIDLIRKNNSDFTEQQILNVLRKQAREDEIAASTNQTLKPRPTPVGPSVVQLDNLLNVVSARMGDFQSILLDPPHSIRPIETTLGSIEPLTIERFRICELYAELLHCSNMALLNRSRGVAPAYDDEGYIVGGTDTIDALALALGPTSLTVDSSPNLNASLNAPSVSAFTSTYTSPNPNSSTDDVMPGLERLALTDSPPHARSSNSSTPGTPSMAASGTSSPSIDSETGYLTRDEARALRALIAADDDASQGDFSPPQRPPEKPRPDIMSAGRRLKAAFLQHGVVETLLDFFFAYPWNNFLHNVVYDLVQQVLNGRPDRPLGRQLCHALFTDCHLPQRILEGHARNTSTSGMRLGYMGHMILIADEVSKFSIHNEEDVRLVLAADFPRPHWDHYVSTSLRELRDRDAKPLGGGVSQPTMEAHQASLALSDDDDEFPMSGKGGKVTQELHDDVPSAEEVGGAGRLGTLAAGDISTGNAAQASPSDQFARYLVSQISGNVPDKFSGTSSDEDDAEEVVSWVGDPSFDPKDVDAFDLGTTDRDPPSFGFDDRWESLDRKALGPSPTEHDAEDDDGFGDMVSATRSHTTANAPNPFAADAFAPGASTSTSAPGVKLTPADFTADWQDHVDRDPFGDDEAVDVGSDDDFGHFESADDREPVRSTSLTNVQLSPGASGDFDFSEYAKRAHQELP